MCVLDKTSFFLWHLIFHFRILARRTVHRQLLRRLSWTVWPSPPLGTLQWCASRAVPSVWSRPSAPRRCNSRPSLQREPQGSHHLESEVENGEKTLRRRADLICSASYNTTWILMKVHGMIAVYLKVHGFHFVFNGMGFPHQLQHRRDLLRILEVLHHLVDGVHDTACMLLQLGAFLHLLRVVHVSKLTEVLLCWWEVHKEPGVERSEKKGKECTIIYNIYINIL